MNSMEPDFKENELLLRAVHSVDRCPEFWLDKKNERLAPAAFVDPIGLSVSRTGKRTICESVYDMKHRLQGCIVSLTVQLCNQINAFLKYCPSKSNIYHSEIHGSKTSILLEDEQTWLMCKNAKIEYRPDIKIYKA